MSLKIDFIAMQVLQMPSTLIFRRCNCRERHCLLSDNLAHRLLDQG